MKWRIKIKHVTMVLGIMDVFVPVHKVGWGHSVGQHSCVSVCLPIRPSVQRNDGSGIISKSFRLIYLACALTGWVFRYDGIFGSMAKYLAPWSEVSKLKRLSFNSFQASPVWVFRNDLIFSHCVSKYLASWKMGPIWGFLTWTETIFIHFILLMYLSGESPQITGPRGLLFGPMVGW